MKRVIVLMSFLASCLCWDAAQAQVIITRRPVVYRPARVVVVRPAPVILPARRVVVEKPAPVIRPAGWRVITVTPVRRRLY